MARQHDARRRAARPPRAESLEDRSLPSGLGATWLGQDGTDVASLYQPGPDGIADIHIELTGLPADQPIGLVDIRPLGGGLWRSDGQGGGRIVVQRPAGSSTAQLLFDPYQADSGRPYYIEVTLGSAAPAALWLTGGPVDPDIRTDSGTFATTWIGQDGTDLTGPTAAVGPDGLADVHLRLAGLLAASPIQSIRVDTPTGDSWEYGLNPSGRRNAEFVANAGDATKGELFFSPTANLNGQLLTLRVAYNSGKVDTSTITAGATDPARRSTAATNLPALTRNVGSVAWIGQDGAGPILGDVHLRFAGLPAGRTIVAATLANSAGASWVYRGTGQAAYYADAYAGSLAIRQGGGTSADLFFQPGRDETGSSLSLRMTLDDGTILVNSLAGGAADPGLRVASPAPISIIAHQGDDLNALANLYGSVHLSAGTYTLTRPLVLAHAVTITSDPGAVLLFSQPAGDAPWTTAIKIHSGNTTLDGFAVRFAGPVRWNTDVSYGPAVIGITDNLDTGTYPAKVDLALTNLDLQGPPAWTAGPWEEAVRLMRLVGAEGGRIVGNTLKGGTIEFSGGPWTIQGNTYLGTLPGTYSYGVFTGHYSSGLRLIGNHAQDSGPSGKTWRFLVLTASGSDDIVSDNTVIGLGPRDGDTIPAMNASEIILTEAYRLHYEGAVAAVSADGLTLKTFAPQGDAPIAGDAVAILAGPAAGQFRRVLQVIDPTTVLLDAPLPAGTTAVSIATGFVNTQFLRNTVDARGGAGAGPLVLAGDLFGTVVRGNTLMGGSSGLRIIAMPTELPGLWGWSHAPFLGGTIDGNTLVDNNNPSFLGTDHSSYIKTNTGRVYFSASLTNNTVRWSADFLAGQPAGGPGAFAIGLKAASDPGETILTTAGNSLSVPAGYRADPEFYVGAAVVNGQVLRDTSSVLAGAGMPAPANLGLVRDTGSSPSDGVTNDPTVRFDPVAGATGYEYRVGASTTYQAVPANPFAPAGIADGTVFLYVRAIGGDGSRGGDALLVFTLDTTATAPPAPTLDPADDRGDTASGKRTNSAAPRLAMSGDATDTLILLRDGVEVMRRVGPGTVADPSAPADGTYRYSVRRVDAAGNAGTGPALVVTIDRTSPVVVPTPPTNTPPSPAAGPTVAIAAAPSATWLGQDGRDLVGLRAAPGKDGFLDAHVQLAHLAGPVASVEIRGVGTSGQWRTDGLKRSYRAIVLAGSSATTAELYFQPNRRETGRSYQILVRYRDGSITTLNVRAGTTNPKLRAASLRQRPLAKFRAQAVARAAARR